MLAFFGQSDILVKPAAGCPALPLSFIVDYVVALHFSRISVVRRVKNDRDFMHKLADVGQT